MSNICPVCGTEQISFDSIPGSGAYLVNCKICGTFMIENDIIDNNRLDEKTRSCLLFYLLNIHSANSNIIPHFHDLADMKKEIFDDKYQYISLDSIKDLYPRLFSDRIDKSLLNISNIFKGNVAGNFRVSKSNDSKLILLSVFATQNYSSESFEFCNLLESMGYISGRGDTTLKYYKLTASGWLRVQELQNNLRFIDQGFIAMWFDDTMKGARDRIISAIRDCGYFPMIIDIKEHNKQIVPEILYELRRSKFVVADLTGNRGGVYYEAGFAHALGKEVILSCKDSDFDTRHFDVSQINTIRWTDESDLYQRLKKRIEATVGNIKNR